MQLQRWRDFRPRQHVPAEHRVVAVQLHVHLADGLPSSVRPGAGVLTRPHSSCGFGRRAAIASAAGLISEGSIAVVRRIRTRSATFRPHAARLEGAEVARQHRRRRHERLEVRRSVPELGALVGAEKEEPIRPDRPAERAAELVTVQTVTHAFAGRRVDRLQRIGRVEAVVAEELEQIAVAAGWCPIS